MMTISVFSTILSKVVLKNLDLSILSVCLLITFITILSEIYLLQTLQTNVTKVLFL